MTFAETFPMAAKLGKPPADVARELHMTEARLQQLLQDYRWWRR